MQRHRSFLLALVLALAPDLGAAAGVGTISPATPVQPFTPGFASLFNSPQPRIIAAPTTATSPVPGAAAAAPPVGMPTATGTFAPGSVCRPALVAAEARHGIPNGLLQAIGVVESGRRDAATGVRQPWPWTINAEGEPHVFDTKEQAVAWVRQAQGRGMQSIDIGCAQVNLMHHPDAFTSLEQAFDPMANADYAARFLRQLRDTAVGGNWMTAVGFYHSQTPELAEAYRQQVQAVTANGTASGTASVRPGPAAASAASGEPHAVAKSETGRLLAQPSGTVGRGLDAYRAAPIQIATTLHPVPLTAHR
jgi:hypothetical protein